MLTPFGQFSQQLAIMKEAIIKFIQEVTTLFQLMQQSVIGIFITMMQSISTLFGGTASAITQVIIAMTQGLVILFSHITTTWTTTMILMSTITFGTVQAIVQVFIAMHNGLITLFNNLATTWSSICNSFGANAQSGASQIISALDDAMNQVTSRMSELASHWSAMCNSMIANAKSAAKGIISALNKIPRRINVTVHVGVEGPGVKFMAKGFHGTVSTPTLMMVGEAGPERVDISKTGSAGTGLVMDRGLNLTPSLPGGRMPSSPQGDTFVQVFLDGKEFQGKIVRIVRKNEAGFV
jgi:phage-related protein